MSKAAPSAAASVAPRPRRGPARVRHAPDPVDDRTHRALSAQAAALYRAMYAVVRRIPRGKVLTYGQLAELAGAPGGARVAGAAMKTSEGLPWQRILGRAGPRRGRIAIYDPVGAAIQRQLLEDEGVAVSAAGTIDLSKYGWLPAEGASPSGPGRTRTTRRRSPANRK